MFKKKKFNYFISFVYMENGIQLLKSSGYTSDSRIRSTMDIYEIEKHFKNQFGYEQLYITNFKLLSKGTEPIK